MALTGLGERMRETFGADIVYVALHDPVADVITFPYFREGGVSEPQKPIPFGQGLTSRIIASGTPQELKKTVGGDVIYLKTDDNKKAIEDIRNLFDAEAAEKEGEIFMSALRGEACIPEIIRALGERVLSVRMQRPTLNDVFLKLTGRTIRDEVLTDDREVTREFVRSHRRAQR